MRARNTGGALLLALWVVAGPDWAWERAPTDPGWYGAGQAPLSGERPAMFGDTPPAWRDEQPPPTPWRRPAPEPGDERRTPWRAAPELEWRAEMPLPSEESRAYRFREDPRFEQFAPSFASPDYRFRPLSPAERRRHAPEVDPRWRPERAPQRRLPDEGFVPPPWPPFWSWPGYEGMVFYPW